MKLYYFETANGRLPCAVAKHLNAPIEYVHTNLVKSQHTTEEFKKLNPNGKIPVLIDGEKIVWESKAIACYIANHTELFPKDDRLIDLIRWFSWDSEHFSNYANTLYYEHVIRPVFGKSARDFLVTHATKQFLHNAQVLDATLSRNQYVLGDQLSLADFVLSRTLFGSEMAEIPYHEFTHIVRWMDELNQIPALQNPWPVKKSA